MNTPLVRCTTAAAVLATLAGCAAQNIPLTPETRAKAGATHVILEVPQEEIAAEIDPSRMAAAMGGGLLWAIADAIADSSKAKSAETAIGPIRTSIADYDFPTRLRTEIDAALAGVDWLERTAIDIDRTPESKLQKTRSRESVARSLLVVRTRYSMSPDFRQVLVKATATLQPAADPGAKPLYRQEFQITRTSTAVGEPASEWTQRQGAPLRAALDDSIHAFGAQLAADLAGRPAPEGRLAAAAK